MLLFHIQFTLQFYIKNYTDNYFFSDHSDKNHWILNPSCEEDRTDFIPTIRPNGGLIIKSAVSNQVLEVDDDNLLNYYPMSGGDYQIFSFVLIGPKTYVIRNIGYCIEYLPEFKVYKSAECSGNDFQKFVVITKEDEDIANTIGFITEKYYNEVEEHSQGEAHDHSHHAHDHSHYAHDHSHHGHSHYADDHSHYAHNHSIYAHDHSHHTNDHSHHAHDHLHYAHDHSHYAHNQEHHAHDHLNSSMGYSYDSFGNIIRNAHYHGVDDHSDDLNYNSYSVYGNLLDNDYTDNNSLNSVHQYNTDTSERIYNHTNNYGNIIGYGFLNGDFYNHFDKNLKGGYSGTHLKYILCGDNNSNMYNFDTYFTGLHSVGKKYHKHGYLIDHVTSTLKI